MNCIIESLFDLQVYLLPVPAYARQIQGQPDCQVECLWGFLDFSPIRLVALIQSKVSLLHKK